VRAWTGSPSRRPSNKAQIYHYFGNKDGLFEAVFHDLVVTTLRDSAIDPTDLPEYAGRLSTVIGPSARAAARHLVPAGARGSNRTRSTSSSRRMPRSRGHREGAGRWTLTDRWSAVDLLGLVFARSGCGPG